MSDEEDEEDPFLDDEEGNVVRINPRIQRDAQFMRHELGRRAHLHNRPDQRQQVYRGAPRPGIMPLRDGRQYAEPQFDNEELGIRRRRGDAVPPAPPQNPIQRKAPVPLPKGKRAGDRFRQEEIGNRVRRRLANRQQHDDDEEDPYEEEAVRDEEEEEEEDIMMAPPPPRPAAKRAPQPAPKQAGRRAQREDDDEDEMQAPVVERRAPTNGQRPHGRSHYANNRVIAARTWVVTLRGGINPVNNAYIGQRVMGTNFVLDYMCGQIEMGASPGVRGDGLHWQGYLEFSGEVTAFDIMQFFGWLPGNVHLEPRFGSQDDAIEYTRKDATQVTDDVNDPQSWHEAGRKHAAGVDGAWRAVRGIVRGGGNMMQMLNDGDLNQFRLLVQFNNGIRNLLNMVDENDDEDEEAQKKKQEIFRVVVYYGDPRTGKSGTVYRRHKFKEVFRRGQAEAQHWTGYVRQPVLLIDDIPLDQPKCPISIGEMKLALEALPMMANQKHGNKRARWTTVYICSNTHPSLWFPNVAQVDRDAVMERIHEIWHFTKNEIRLEKGPGEFPPIPDPKVPNQPRIVRQPDPPQPQQLPPAPPTSPVLPKPAAPPRSKIAFDFDRLQELCKTAPFMTLEKLLDLADRTTFTT